LGKRLPLRTLRGSNSSWYSIDMRMLGPIRSLETLDMPEQMQLIKTNLLGSVLIAAAAEGLRTHQLIEAGPQSAKQKSWFVIPGSHMEQL